jgi:hypothetical protein
MCNQFRRQPVRFQSTINPAHKVVSRKAEMINSFLLHGNLAQLRCVAGIKQATQNGDAYVCARALEQAQPRVTSTRRKCHKMQTMRRMGGYRGK